MRSRSWPSHEREYAIHDTALQGFMLRVQPNGARAAALAFLAREKGGGSPLPLPDSGPTLAKLAAEYVERRPPSWKPSTLKATMSYLNSAILPAIGHLRVGAVVRADIACFFHEYGRRKPDGANRSHMIYCATCSTAQSRGAIGPKPQGTRARASSAIGDRRAGDCSVRTI